MADADFYVIDSPLVNKQGFFREQSHLDYDVSVWNQVETIKQGVKERQKRNISVHFMAIIVRDL